MAISTRQLLALQVRVIGALVLRETRATFGSSQIGYLWAIITPAASVAVLVTIFSLVGRSPPFGNSFALFFATGVLTLEYFNKLSNGLIGAMDANKALLTYPVIKVTDTLFARTILITATYILIMLLFFGGLVLFGLAQAPAFPDKVIEAVLVTGFLGFGFGTVNAVILSQWESWRHIEKILTRPLMFISGVFYVPSLLPPEAQAVLWWNPILHLVEWFRMGYYPNYDSRIFDAWYPLGIAIGLTLLGLGGERLTRKKRT
ncbi:ABC transporter permease [Pseudooceanicola sp. GBMRC 2024]|uniref:ABC transporter permease n=1 Tax=Pseudooceanicola albus TaxID=2692189 RepID=A0A6L7G9H3_9RHOB|nr:MULTISPECIES: ABC transporter permease [Pseudooceanicola]MXN20178.1 ABC transporter permease [Pseudooceanicola albus]